MKNCNYTCEQLKFYIWSTMVQLNMWKIKLHTWKTTTMHVDSYNNTRGQLQLHIWLTKFIIINTVHMWTITNTLD